jgi:hypothetical protein
MSPPQIIDAFGRSALSFGGKEPYSSLNLVPYSHVLRRVGWIGRLVPGSRYLDDRTRRVRR